MDVLQELTQVVQSTSQRHNYIRIDRGLANDILRILNRTDAPSAMLSEAERHLTPNEFRIFRALYQAKMMVTYGQLMNHTGIETIDSLWVHIRRLRVKLAKHEMGSIDTIRERGYIYRENDSE